MAMPVELRARVAPRAHPPRRAGLDLALVAVPVLVSTALAVRYYGAHQLGVDFYHDFWIAGRLVAGGHGPYAWSRWQIAHLVSFPYPAPAALLFAPASLLPHQAATVAFVAVCAISCAAALAILGVRDPRVYAVALLWCPVVNGWQTANLTLPLAFGAAALWRYRDSPAAAGALAGAMLALKPVVWPLLLWLACTRRLRAAGYGVLSALALNVISWLVLGPSQLEAWVRLLSRQADVLYAHGYGLIALAVHLGARRWPATAAMAAAAAALIALTVRAGRRGENERALTLAVVLVIAASPLVDSHYLALLIVPLAIAAPTLRPVWLAPLILWLCPATNLAAWQLVLAWATVAAVALALREPAEPLVGSPPRLA